MISLSKSSLRTVSMTCFQIGPVESRSISLHGRITFFVCHLKGLFIFCIKVSAARLPISDRFFSTVVSVG